MWRVRFKIVTRFLLLGACVAGVHHKIHQTQAFRKPSALPEWSLGHAQTIDLKFPAHFFQGMLSSSPTVEGCHTQGLEMDETFVYITCFLYDTQRKMHQAFEGESLLLRAPVSELFDSKTSKSIHWEILDLTERVPQDKLIESERLTRWTPAKLLRILNPRPIPVAGHPSGIVADFKKQGLWIANTVGGAGYQYSRLELLNLRSLERIQPAVEIFDTISAIAPVGDDFVVGFVSDKKGILVDQRGRVRELEFPRGSRVDYQDCATWDSRTLICSGNISRVAWNGFVREGKVNVLRFFGDSFETLTPKVIAELHFRNGHSTVSTWGQRRFWYVEGIGDIDWDMNDYGGGFKSPLTLTNNALAVSPDKKYVYFLPEDIPNTKLIRLEWVPTESISPSAPLLRGLTAQF